MFCLLCLRHREPGRISQSELVPLRLLPRLMVSLGKRKVTLFQIPPNYLQQRETTKMPANEKRLFHQGSDYDPYSTTIA